MNSSMIKGDRGSRRTPEWRVPRITTVGDVLYLISSQHSWELGTDALRKLDDAKIWFIRGHSGPALDSIDAALRELDDTTAARRDVIAFRHLVATLAGEDVLRSLIEADAGSVSPPDALSVMSLCLSSVERWHSGDLTQGLWLNQSAVQHAKDAAPMWRFYADFLLAKKLIDIHVSYQAERVIRDMRGMVRSAGLLAFGSVPEALNSLLQWQTGRFDEAMHSIRLAMRMSQQYDSAFGMKIALSVAAMVHVSRAEWDEAAEDLELFHARSDYYSMPDSHFRAAFAEVVLLLARQGPRAAADRIRAKWHLLGTRSGSFIEDPGRPAWLVSVARQAGDTDLAERSVREIEQLAERNRGVALLEVAALHARTALAGGTPDPASSCEFGRPLVAVPEDPPGPAESTATVPRPDVPPDDAGTTPPARPASLGSLTLRETEIARLVGQGMTNEQVAQRLGLSPHTVNFHLRNIFRKLSISTRVKLGSIIGQLERGRAV
ncbi:LuxR C-terminal-related transcriptional regulator [Streptomyces sp. NPDC059169]|uniref:LuxR C-terminal-related transcriptional regulator n=1 Tax=unclassified Streptomyces TaxID=2593676 RepID=UPI003690DD21